MSCYEPRIVGEREIRGRQALIDRVRERLSDEPHLGTDRADWLSGILDELHDPDASLAACELSFDEFVAEYGAEGADG